MEQFILDELEELKRRSLYRRLPRISGEQGPTVFLDGKEVVMLSSNNYLGLANHPALKRAAKEAVDRYGCGAGASRLISGTMDLHRTLEEKLAAFKGTEAALLFNSGYHANIGVLSAIAGEQDVIFSDELNHASIIDGCRLSRAEVKIYRHCDPDHLESLLARSLTARRRILVTDAVFSMDGDRAPLRELGYLAERYHVLLMVDEAHTTGVFGPRGAGLVEEVGLERGAAIQMGTLGKALGSFGAYVAGSRELIDLLINRSRSFIYTTALPPPILAAAAAALEIVEKEPALRQRLWANVAYLKEGLGARGYCVGGSQSHILPLRIGGARQTMVLSEYLLGKGVFVQGIRPPTVPEGTSRLRIAPMATHTRIDLDRALAAFAEAGPMS